MSKSKAVAKVNKEKTALTSAGALLGRGFENVDMSTVTMPRAKVMQGLSPELQDGDYDFRQGDIIHGLLMEKLPEKFIPISLWDSNTLFLPRDTSKHKEFFEALGIEPVDNLIICKSLDAKVTQMSAMNYKSCNNCPYKEFGWDGNPNTPPLCDKTINVLALFEGMDMPVVIMFYGTNYKYGRRFRDLALFSGGDLFSKKYKITSVKESNDKGTYFVTPVKPAGKATEEEIALAEEMYTRFANVRIDVDIDEEPEAEVEAPEY